jgi:hypothetical protein
MSEQVQRSLSRVLGLLDEPRTTREIYQALLSHRWEAWAEEEGVTIEWAEDGTPRDPAVWLLSWCRERMRDEALNPEQVYNRLRRLEREGLIQRVQIPGRRPMLWFRPRSTTAASLPGTSQ